MANVAYIRVSTIQQNTDRQYHAMKDIAIDKWFEDKKSGKNEDRDQLKEMLNYVRAGDHVYVANLDRIGRNLIGILKMVEDLRGRGVVLHCLKEGYVLGAEKNALQEAFFQMMGVLAQLERNIMLERQAEAYAAAKASGKQIGRGKSKRRQESEEFVIEALKNGHQPAKIARAHKISRTSVYRIRDQAIKDGKLPANFRVKAANIN
ncbi:recombinase family protein [Escherichia coli]|uniref:recombinase family protein n=1 Tax=Escherichia coli TaxID=562 RepID=UPI001F0D8AD9|nr:recombinase family protein [Escherichia coli]MCH4774751.1 recombinase family protein [Escherichia coli]